MRWLTASYIQRKLILLRERSDPFGGIPPRDPIFLNCRDTPYARRRTEKLVGWEVCHQREILGPPGAPIKACLPKYQSKKRLEQTL